MGCDRKRIVISEVPSHITGFFSVFDNEDPSLKGSTGCGLTLSFSVRTKVENSERNELIFLGERKRIPTFENLLNLMNAEGIRAEIISSPPLAHGLGVSGAVALGTALCISLLRNMNLSYFEAGERAHIAEVISKTGLGDVIAESTGGVVIRRKPGAPGIGIADRLPVPELPVNLLFLGEKRTENILQDEEILRKVNEIGSECLRRFMREKTLRSFISLSYLFARETGIVDDELIEIVGEIMRKGGMAGVAMIGRTIFQINGNDLREYGEVFSSKITNTPGRIVHDSEISSKI